ncbi:GNAT family N-acetyltransferase [soil metagenome]
MTLRLLNTVQGLERCAELQKSVWGGANDALGGPDMVALVHAGGMAAGAFEGDELAGFVFGFPSYLPDAPRPNGLHSHLLAVLPEYRGHGLGKALKWFQRDWCLARGLAWMTWTFDPLQAKNARLNLEHLGAVVEQYRVDEYGAMGGALAGTLPTDRLLAFWEMEAPRTLALAQGLDPATLVLTASALKASSLTTLPTVLTDQSGRPAAPDTTRTELRLRVEIPADFTELLHRDPDTALAWRLAAREVLKAYLDKGYVITRFLEETYLLEAKRQLNLRI